MGVENRLTRLFAESDRKLLSVFFTAGFPGLGDTVPLCEALERHGADLIEVGFPFSDSLVDGPTIQMSNERALGNGMSMEVLFGQLERVRATVSLPLLLMTCVNPVLCFGMERFADELKRTGLDGVIIPDLPPEYFAPYRKLFEERCLSVVFLVTAHTPEARVRLIDDLGSGFIYAVSSDAVTGNVLEVDEARGAFFRKLECLGLRNPFLVGFGITDERSFQKASEHSRGAIVGSAFIRALSGGGISRPGCGVSWRHSGGRDDRHSQAGYHRIPARGPAQAAHGHRLPQHGGLDPERQLSGRGGGAGV